VLVVRGIRCATDARRVAIGHSGFVLYQLHEYNRALLSPAAELAKAGAYLFSAPGSWFAHLPGANRVAAAYELLYRLGKEYDKPAWGIDEVDIDLVWEPRWTPQAMSPVAKEYFGIEEE